MLLKTMLGSIQIKILNIVLLILNSLGAIVYLSGIYIFLNVVDTYGSRVYTIALPFAVLGFLCNLIPIFYAFRRHCSTYMLVSNILALILNLIFTFYLML